MTTKIEQMYKRIEEHGRKLNVIFGTTYDTIELCKKLRSIELRQS